MEQALLELATEVCRAKGQVQCGETGGWNKGTSWVEKAVEKH